MPKNFCCIYIVLFFLPFTAINASYAQKITEKFLFRDTGDSSLVKSEIRFGKNGDYRIEKSENYIHYFLNATDTLGPLKMKYGSSFGFYTPPGNPDIQYAVPLYPTGWFGPMEGRDLGNYRHPEAENMEHVAMATYKRGKVNIFVDGKKAFEIDSLSNNSVNVNGKSLNPFEAKKQYFSGGDWLEFSDNGHYITTFENNGYYGLYVDDKLIDTSRKDFYQFKINNEGQYIYASGRKPWSTESYKYAYMFFIHVNNKVFGPVRTVWRSYLADNGCYYFAGDDDGPAYVLVNDSLYRNVNNVSNVMFCGKSYFFRFKKNNEHFFNVNGKKYKFDYEEIYEPVIDEKGNFACYGFRDYYIYRMVNGKEMSQITKYGVRPEPVYISPTGSSYHYFRTDDSTYFYKDDKLVFPAFQNELSFSVTDLKNERYSHDRALSPVSFKEIKVDTVSYFLYNELLFGPVHMPRKKENSPTGIVKSSANSNGCYTIEWVSKKTLRITVDNKHVLNLEDIDTFYDDNIYFDKGSLLFYGRKGLSFYQYSVTW